MPAQGIQKDRDSDSKGSGVVKGCALRVHCRSLDQKKYTYGIHMVPPKIISQ